MGTLVSDFPAATPAEAFARFQDRFRFETDCWDVHESLESSHRDFVLVDARSQPAYEKGHVPGSINIPHRTMTAERMREYARGSLFVVYCDGPHCNGAARAAVRLASLGFCVKEMMGGITGWLDDGFALHTGGGVEMALARPEGGQSVVCGC